VGEIQQVNPAVQQSVKHCLV